MFSWEENTGQAQIEVERLYLCTGLGMPQNPQSELADVIREREVWGLLRYLYLDKR